MKLSIKAGATSQSVNVYVQNSGSFTGAGLSGLAYNTSGLTAYYSFAGANAGSVAIALATLGSTTAAYSSGGFVQLDATNMTGWYRLDLPNAALAASSGRSVALHLQGAAGMAPCPVEIELTGWDNQDGVHAGLSALPNAAAAASGGLLISGSNAGTTTLAALTVTGVTTHTGAVSMAAGLSANITGDLIGTVSTLTTYTGNSPQTGDSFARLGAPSGASIDADILSRLASSSYVAPGTPPTAASIATAVWTDATPSDFTAAGSPGLLLDTNLNAAVSSRLPASSYVAPTTPPTVAAIAAGILATPADLLATDASGRVLLQPSQPGVTIPTVTTLSGSAPQTGDSYARLGAPSGASIDADILTRLAASSYVAPTTPPTAASIAAAIWTDATPGDFTVAGTPGLLLSTNLDATVSSRLPASSYVAPPTPPTAAAIATAVWTDATAGDFTAAGSPGKVLLAQLGGAFTTSSSSIYSAGALANAPAGGGGGATAAAIATAVWTDTTAGDFTVAGSPGAFVAASTAQTGDSFARLGAPAGASIAADILTRSTYAGGAVTLASSGLDAVVVEAGLNARQSLAIIAAACAGRSSGVAAGSPVYRGAGVAATRITATAAYGDRSAVALSPPL